MRVKHLTLGERVLITLLASLCLCCSCSEFDASSREDYIGPKVSEPNTMSTAVVEVNTVNAAAPAAASQAAGGDGPLKMTVGQAMLSALENNKSLVVQRFNPQIERTFEQQERAAFFEPVLTGELANEKK